MVVTSSSCAAVGERRDIEVLRHRRALAVGHAVLAQVAGAQVRRDDAQAAAAVRRRSTRSQRALDSPCQLGGAAGRRSRAR